MYHRKRTRGGASKKQTKFPRISSYLETHENEVYQLFEDSGTTHFLTPTRNQTGKTLMLPDAKLIKKIRNQIDSDNPEVATDMLMSLTIPLPLKTPEDWERMKKDIPTAYGNKIIFKSQDGKKVFVEGGELTLDTKFQPLERIGKSKRGDVFIWKLKGEIDYENAPQATMEFGGEISRDYKEEITTFINDSLKKEIDQIKDGDKNNSHILNIVCNFIAHIKRLEDQKLLTFVKESVCPEPLISFFMIFGSHSLDDKTMFDSRFLCDVLPRLNGAVDKPVDYLMKFCTDHSDLRDAGLWFGNQKEVARVRAIIANNKLDNININNTATHIIKIYDDLDTKNTLGNLSNVLPQYLFEKYKKNPGLHLRRDEARYLLHSFYQNVHTVPHVRYLQVPEMEEMVRCVKQIYGSNYEIDSEKRHIFRAIVSKMSDLDKLSNNSIKVLEEFLESSFLFIPCYTGKVDIYGGDEDTENLEHRMANNIYDKYENNDFKLSDQSLVELRNYAEHMGDIELLRKIENMQ